MGKSDAVFGTAFFFDVIDLLGLKWGKSEYIS